MIFIIYFYIGGRIRLFFLRLGLFAGRCFRLQCGFFMLLRRVGFVLRNLRGEWLFIVKIKSFCMAFRGGALIRGSGRGIKIIHIAMFPNNITV